MAPEAEQGKLRNDLCEGLLDGFHSQGSGSGDRSRSRSKPASGTDVEQQWWTLLWQDVFIDDGHYERAAVWEDVPMVARSSDCTLASMSLCNWCVITV